MALNGVARSALRVVLRVDDAEYEAPGPCHDHEPCHEPCHEPYHEPERVLSSPQLFLRCFLPACLEVCEALRAHAAQQQPALFLCMLTLAPGAHRWEITYSRLGSGADLVVSRDAGTHAEALVCLTAGETVLDPYGIYGQDVEDLGEDLRCFIADLRSAPSVEVAVQLRGGGQRTEYAGHLCVRPELHL